MNTGIVSILVILVFAGLDHPDISSRILALRLYAPWRPARVPRCCCLFGSLDRHSFISNIPGRGSLPGTPVDRNRKEIVDFYGMPLIVPWPLCDVHGRGTGCFAVNVRRAAVITDTDSSYLVLRYQSSGFRAAALAVRHHRGRSFI